MLEKKFFKCKIIIKFLEEKYKVFKDIENGVVKKEVVMKYSIFLNILFMWVKDKEKILFVFENGKSLKIMKFKGVGFDFLDKVIYKWFMNVWE